jgi:hypothetical protein
VVRKKVEWCRLEYLRRKLLGMIDEVGLEQGEVEKMDDV